MEVKDCPFCGDEADIYSIDGELPDGNPYELYVLIGCSHINCAGYYQNHEYANEEEALEAWNRRA